MDKRLREHGFIDDFTVTLPLTKAAFIRHLKVSVDPGEIGGVSATMEAWRASDNDFTGEVTGQGFRIRERIGFFQANGLPKSVATGTFREDGDQLVVVTEVRAQTGLLIPVWVLSTIAFLGLVTVVVYGIITEEKGIGILIPFLILYAGLAFLLPYWLLRRGVRQTRRNLERRFSSLPTHQFNPGQAP